MLMINLKYREINSNLLCLGLANLFQNGSELFQKPPLPSSSINHSTSVSSTTGVNKLSTASTNDHPDHMKAAVLEWFQSYIGELAKDIHTKIGSEWNGTGEQAQLSALTSSFVTFVRRLNLPLKQVGKLDIDKIPVFVSVKKMKSGKSKLSSSSASQISLKSHSFVDCAFLSVRTVCVKCGQPFWGIGYQGMICQSKRLSI